MKTEDTSELVSHLLDEIESLKSKGLNDEEAFFVAQKRIGAIKDLVNEYEKVNPSLSFLTKSKPFLLGILSYLVFMEMINVLSVLFMGINIWTGFQMPHSLGVICICLLFVGILFIIYKNTNMLRKKVVNFLFLGITLIVLKAITIASMTFLANGGNYSLIGHFKMQTVLFNAFLIGFLLIISMIIYFKEKRSKTFSLKVN